MEDLSRFFTPPIPASPTYSRLQPGVPALLPVRTCAQSGAHTHRMRSALHHCGRGRGTAVQVCACTLFSLKWRFRRVCLCACGGRVLGGNRDGGFTRVRRSLAGCCIPMRGEGGARPGPVRNHASGPLHDSNRPPEPRTRNVPICERVSRWYAGAGVRHRQIPAQARSGVRNLPAGRWRNIGAGGIGSGSCRVELGKRKLRHDGGRHAGRRLV